MSSIPTTGNVIVIAEERKVIINPIAAAGIGLPSGGQLNQALVKNSTADYDTIWSNVVLEVTGDGVDNTDPMRPTLSFPTPDEIGAYSNTNPDGFVDAAGAANAAPVQSVNGDTGNVSVFDGGVTGDILVKNSNTNYDTSWTDSITVDKITYDTTAAETVDTIGQTAWDADARTLAINKGNGVIQNITQELNYAPARNTEATALQRGELVMVDPAQPAQGMTLRLKRYVSNGTYPVDLFVGVVSETIQPNETGFVEFFGRLNNLSLSALQPSGETWQEGDILWPNPSIAGGMTKVEPSAPAHKVTVAAILRITGQNVLIQVRPNLRSRISDLHDVQVTNVSNSQILSWNGTAWVNTNNEADGVLSVTGDGVDNTDPQNPVLSFPTVDEIGAYSNTNPDNFVNASGAAASAPIQSVTGDGVDNTNVGNVVISYPTVDDIGAYSNTNPANYINVAQAAAAAPVQSVNGQTNVVVLNADDVGAYSNTNPSGYVNAVGAAAAAPIQTVTGDGVDNTNVGNVVISFPTLDDIGAYSNTNPANYVNAAGAAAAAPVQSVNGQTNVVNLALDDLTDVNVTNATGGQTIIYNASTLSWEAVTIAAGGVQSVTGDGVNNTDPANPVLSFPTLDQIGAYSNTNPDNFVNATGAAAAAPVQSVNGQTNVVVLDADDVGAYSNTNPANYINVAQAAAAAPVQSVNGQTNVVVLGADDVGAYSNTNPANYINVAQAAAAAPVQSVNGQTNVVVLTADDVGAYSNTNPSNYINVAQAAAAAPIQTVTGDGVDNTNVGNVVISYPTVDDIGAYSNTNPANYINVAQASAAAPVQSVNGQTNVVVLTADDVGAYSNTNPASYINVAQAAAAAPIQSVTGTLVTGTSADPVINIPTADQVGAYSNTNPLNFINVAQAADAAPVQSVNGSTGNVNVSVSSLTDTNITNAVDGEVLTYQSGEWINAAGGGGGQTVSNLQIVYLSQVFN